MKIGCVTEIKKQEYRVGMTPSCAAAYVSDGNEVYIQQGAGAGSGFADEEYEEAGAKLLPDAKSVFDTVDMIIKVKEPLPEEYGLFREGQILYTYLHFAADEVLTKAMLDAKVKGIAYETIERNGTLPCLKPMSQIAGRLSVQEGAKYLEKPFGGRGVLLGGVPGVERGKVTIIGSGVVGTNACQMAVGLGANVTVLDVNLDRLEYLEDVFGARINTLNSTEANIIACLKESDLVIGAVLIPGAVAPKLVKRSYLKHMKKGAVMVDVAVDQGGCFETTKPTSHNDPTFEVDGVVNYCVANMPGAVPRTATIALTNTTLAYGRMIARLGVEEACKKSEPLLKGLNVYEGKCTYEAVADAFSLPYTPPLSAMG
ncbi:MAG: alanine dehydrogenase [Christensenellaceae bacterium]